MDKSLAIPTPTTAIAKFRQCNTPAKCMSSDTPQLAVIRKEAGDEKVLSVLITWIIDLNDFLNISRKMNPNQIKQTAMLILEEYYYLNLADINLVFTRAKKGQYGNLYESLDGMKIFSWFDQYERERAGIASAEQLREHDNLKAINGELR